MGGLAAFGGGGRRYFRGVANFGIYWREQFLDVTFGGGALLSGFVSV